MGNAINIVIVGHVDHGKSTLIGRLLYDSETLPDSRITEIQKLLEEYKKSFEFAYFLDSFREELEEERTIDTTRVMFKGKNYYTIVDVPGNRLRLARDYPRDPGRIRHSRHHLVPRLQGLGKRSSPERRSSCWKEEIASLSQCKSGRMRPSRSSYISSETHRIVLPQ